MCEELARAERLDDVAGNLDRTQDELRMLESRRELPEPEHRQEEPDPDHARRVSRTATTWPGRVRALGAPSGHVKSPVGEGVSRSATASPGRFRALGGPRGAWCGARAVGRGPVDAGTGGRGPPAVDDRRRRSTRS